jgi:hypothetical protein
MRRVVAYAGGHHVADDHRGRPFGNDVRRADAGGHVTYTSRRHAADEDLRETGRDRAADMGDRPGAYHRAGVHVAYSCCWRHVLTPFVRSQNSESRIQKPEARSRSQIEGKQNNGKTPGVCRSVPAAGTE